MSDDIHPALRKRASDHAAEILKIGTSIIDVLLPGASKAVDYFIDQALPRREERFAQFLTDLSRRLKRMEQERGDGFLGDWTAGKQALFERGSRVAIEALTTERIDQLAGVVAEGLSGEEADVQRQLMLLELIAQISDLDVVLLCSKTDLASSAEWSAKHGATLMRGRHQDPETPITRDNYARLAAVETERQVVGRLQIDRLIRLGLLAREEGFYLDGTRTFHGPPQVVRKVEHPRITPLGLTVLQKLEVWNGRIPRPSRDTGSF